MLPELDCFNYALAPDRIARRPTPERDGARLLVLERETGALEHSAVRELPRWLAPSDLLVLNATRVLPARLRGCKSTGGAAEALLLGPLASGRFRALVRCRGRLRPGQKFRFGPGDSAQDAELIACEGRGEGVLAFSPDADPYRVGEPPLPPYLGRAAEPADSERYQTVFARVSGSVAAPTAGLHLSEALLDRLTRAGIERAEVVLHIGWETFRPLRETDLARGRLHPEPFELPEATAAAIARTRERGGRVVAVGTSSARVLESCALPRRRVRPGRGATDLFLRPGPGVDAPAPFRVVDALVTNFHLPRSSLLLLVAAFAGRGRILAAYAEAIRAGYRFYSYGDAMLIR